METNWGKPGPDESVAQINPNRTAFSSQHREFIYMKHPDGINGLIKVDKNTGEIQPGSINAAHPVWLPEELRDIPQRYVNSCSTPSDNNRGCWAAVGGGCPMAKFRPQPSNVIIMKDGYFDSVRCFHAYTGRAKSGFPTSQAAYLNRGWEIVTDRTSVPRHFMESYKDENGIVRHQEVTREVEVTDLAKFYTKKEPVAEANGSEPVTVEATVRQKRKYVRKSPYNKKRGTVAD